MKVYNYDAKTGAFVGSSTADPDPLEPMRWLIPANATTIAPPALTLPDTVQKFAGGEWSIVPDFRGLVYWVGRRSHVIEEIGEVVPEDGSLEPPEGMGDDDAAPPPSDEITSEHVNAERDRRVLNGKIFWLTEYPDPIVLAGDPTSRENLGEQKDVAKHYKEAGVTDPILKWRDEGNTIHLLTPDQMIELWLLAVTYAGQIYEAAWALKPPLVEEVPADYAEDHHWPA